MIRELNTEEIPEALDLAWRVFQEYESPVYSPEGTEEFKKCLHDDKYLEGITYYGSFDEEKLVGVVGIRMETRHICFFFVDGKYHRKGLGRSLFHFVKEKVEGMSITLNSSPYGVLFYKALGFTATSDEQTVNGIRFTPMICKGEKTVPVIVKLSGRRDLAEVAANWFASKWGIPKEVYFESIEESFSQTVPSWYVCLDGEKIVAGMGVIENDFHDRKDLTPNVCAVYTESFYRNQGLAGKLLQYVCDDMATKGIDTLYLITDHDSFYERYGWEFICMAQGEGDEEPSRMYMHQQKVR